jgi:hypothetical protein
MQNSLRPYATAGVAIVGASIIAVTPVAAPPTGAQVRPVQLVDAWSDLISESTANWQSILSGADSSAISQVYSAFLTNPSGVIDALTNLTPTVATHLTSLPGTISVDLPPGLELAIAELGATGATLTALNTVAGELTTNPYEAIGTVLNGFLNGEDNISLLNGAITIPLWNGILAPEQSVNVDLNLTALIDALGLGNTDLSNLDLSSLLSQLGLGDLNLGTLFSDLGLSSKGLGTLLADATNPVTTLSGLLNLLGLDNLGSGDSITLTLTNILSGLGLDTNVNLDSLNLDQVLTDFNLNPNADINLGTLLSDLGGTDSALATFLNTGLGTELSNLGLLTGLVTDLNGVLGTLLNNPQIASLFTLLGLPAPGSLLSLANLETALNGTVANPITVDSLLGGGTLNDSLSNILTALGVSGVNPSGLTVGGLLHDLGFSSATGDLTLGTLLSDLGNPFGALNITDLLNGLNLGQLLGDLGLSNLPVDLSNLGDLSGLTVSDLLGDLGLGDLATVSVQPIGGLVTELVDTVPQQILTALGM